MSFFSTWRQKLWFVLKVKFVQWFDIEPILKRDPNAYCPACGHRKGRFLTMSDRTHVVIRHFCEVCSWIWDEDTVTNIQPGQIITTQEEDDAEELEKRGSLKVGPRFVTIPPRGADGVKVNNQQLPESIGEEAKKKPTPVVGTM